MFVILKVSTEKIIKKTKQKRKKKKNSHLLFYPLKCNPTFRVRKTYNFKVVPSLHKPLLMIVIL